MTSVPALEVGGGHADLGEAELVRPVEEPAVGELVGDDLAALHRGQGVDVVVQARLAEADHGEVPRAAPDVHAVHVDVGGQAAGVHRGWAARYLEPRRPCSSAATVAK